jgi:UPF0755 protein
VINPKTVRRLTLGLLAVVVVAIAATAWLLVVYPSGRGPGRGRDVGIEIAERASLGRVASQLERERVIGDATIFALYARMLGAQDRLREGTVMLDDAMSPREVLTRIATGYGPTRVSVTVPEGFTRFDIARRLERWGVCEAQAFIAASADPAVLARLNIEGPSAEGYLFPDTYRLPTNATPERVMQIMVGQWNREVLPEVEEHSAGMAALRRDLGWGLHEVTTLASIVEKEAAVADEQPLIAGVFLNRLRRPDFTPRRLQADPTVSYGCEALGERVPSCQGFDGRRITRPMLGDPNNPYNTYRIEGLPPGPIANPGVGAIRSVLAPAQHAFLYFVAKGGGRHEFSETLEAHEAAIERYLR